MLRGQSAAESEENAHYSGIGAVIVHRRMADPGIYRSDLSALGRHG
jgi:hypothetical protein